MSFNLSVLFEAVVDADPDREVLVVGDRRLTYRALDERANRLANHLADAGIGPGDHVGLQLTNGSEYVEGMFAAWKLRAVPINVNYRYVEAELRYLFKDADLRALVVHGQFGDRVAPVAADVEDLDTILIVADGTPTNLAGIDYERALANADPARPDVDGRSSDDLYITYTGGTTGMPKGVVWRHEDIFKAAMGGGDLTQLGNWVSGPDELAERLPESGVVGLATPPLMHASAHWLTCHQLFTGGKVVLVPQGRFDPAEIWRLVTDEGVFMLIIVGDAMAKPLLDELEANPGDYTTDGLWVIASGGAILSEAAKGRIRRLLPDRMIVDAFGSSETGVLGNKSGKEGATFQLNDQTAVVAEDGSIVAPGSGLVGRLARRGHVPLRYHKDPEKTARTFVEIDGARYVLPGDMATVESDGTITLLGRGSLCINTGGEKVYPEEVEEPLMGHPDVEDALIVGVDDERWGQRVTAVVQPAAGATPDLEEIQGFLRDHVAGYKIPRGLVVVDRIVRSPAGKADYSWAKEVAAASVG
ncbi:MAG: acyl-CoA synthetase [Nitriliruptorales bacterium]|nr:acyl-CoA synthetase [Nitriliruptorales bacterium]